MSQTLVRNKQVDGALQSSTNGGQFAKKKTEVSGVKLNVKVPLPKGYQHIPNPAPGQTLFDGRPAPATFAEAWTQTFAPLTAAETKVGQTMRRGAAETRKHALLSSVDLETAELGGIHEISIRTVDGKDILDVHSWSQEQSECTHDEDGYVGGDGRYYEPEEVDPEYCADLSCECFHCTLEHVENHPAYFGQSVDEKERVTLSFTLPDGAADKAQKVFEAFEGLDELSQLRSNAAGKPWSILSPVGLQRPTDDPEYLAATKASEEAQEASAEYDGIMPDGRVIDKYPRSKYVEEMEELRWSIFKAEGYRLPNESLYERSSRENVTEYLKSRHAEHEKVVAELTAIEAALGKPVSASVRQGALSVHSNEHHLYERGVLAGKTRQAEIVENSKAATAKLVAASEKRGEIWKDLCGRAQIGSGWPEGTLNAPTQEEWRELSQQD